MGDRVVELDCECGESFSVPLEEADRAEECPACGDPVEVSAADRMRAVARGRDEGRRRRRRRPPGRRRPDGADPFRWKWLISGPCVLIGAVFFLFFAEVNIVLSAALQPGPVRVLPGPGGAILLAYLPTLGFFIGSFLMSWVDRERLGREALGATGIILGLWVVGSLVSEGFEPPGNLGWGKGLLAVGVWFALACFFAFVGSLAGAVVAGRPRGPLEAGAQGSAGRGPLGMQGGWLMLGPLVYWGLQLVVLSVVSLNLEMLGSVARPVVSRLGQTLFASETRGLILLYAVASLYMAGGGALIGWQSRRPAYREVLAAAFLALFVPLALQAIFSAGGVTLVGKFFELDPVYYPLPVVALGAAFGGGWIGERIPAAGSGRSPTRPPSRPPPGGGSGPPRPSRRP